MSTYKILDLNKEASESGITPIVRDLNMRLVSNGQNEVYDLLNQSPAIFGNQIPHNYGDSIGYFSDNGRLFQIKPGNPKGAAKYLTPSGQSPDIFTPCIPGPTRVRVTPDIAESKDYWLAVEKDSSIDLVITEGSKKSLSLVSNGVIAIAFAGIDTYTIADESGKRVIHPQLARFLTTGRKITVAFDQDVKPATRVKVESARLRLIGRMLDYCPTIIVRNAVWNPALGKGIDDLIVALPFSEIEDILEGAKEVVVEAGGLAPRQKTSLYSMTDKGPKILDDSKIVDRLIQNCKAGDGSTQFMFSRTHLCFMVYRLGLWVEVSDNYMESIVDKALEIGLRKTGIGWDAAKVSGLVKLLRMRTSAELATSDRNFIPFTNGVLDLKTMAVSAHSPSYNFTDQRPYAYDASLETPQPIVDFLMQAMGGCEIKVSLLRAYLRATVTHRIDLQKFLQIVGGGGTGKSTFANLMFALIGAENVITMSLDQMGGQFAAAEIRGKALVYCPDIDPYAKSLAPLKQLTGGDPLTAELKGVQKRQSFYSQAMLLVAGNSPIVGGSDDGLMRRLITIYFDNKIAEGSRRDLISFDCGQARGEFAPLIPALMNWVLAMSEGDMVDLLSNSSSIAQVSEGNAQALAESDPLAAFVLERISFNEQVESRLGLKKEIHENGETRFDGSDWKLYPAYLSFCLESGIKKPLSLKAFSGKLIIVATGLGHKVTKSSDNKGVVVTGCFVTPRSEEEPKFVFVQPVIETIVSPEPATTPEAEMIEEFEYNFEFSEDETAQLLTA